MVLHWSLSYSASPQVSRTCLRILAVLSNAVVWIVSTRPPISKFPRPFILLLLLLLLFECFYTSVSWWFTTAIWVTTNLLSYRTHLSILADLNNTIVWIVSTCPLISKYSSPSTNPMLTLPSVPLTIDITIIFIIIINIIIRVFLNSISCWVF